MASRKIAAFQAHSNRVDSAGMNKLALNRRQFSFAVASTTLTVWVKPAPGTDAADAPYVVDSAWLQARLPSDPNVVLLDASSLRTYTSEHIRGAVHCWWQDTMEWNNVVYGTTLSTGGTAARAQLLEDLGIDDSTLVVAYDDENNRWAARMVWFLRWLNHGAAAVLDGGLNAWKSANGPVGRGSNSAAKRGIPTIKTQSSLLISTSRLQTRLKTGQSQIVDVRTDNEAHDTANGASKLGRMPTSISFPWTNAMADDRLKTADELRALLTSAGIAPVKEIILYARYGVETAHSWVVLKSLGYPSVAIYDLGFVGWQMFPDRPFNALPPV